MLYIKLFFLRLFLTKTNGLFVFLQVSGKRLLNFFFFFFFLRFVADKY